jgi:hypothetical protein
MLWNGRQIHWMLIQYKTCDLFSNIVNKEDVGDREALAKRALEFSMHGVHTLPNKLPKVSELYASRCFAYARLNAAHTG